MPQPAERDPELPTTRAAATVVVLFNPNRDDLFSLAQLVEQNFNVIAVINAISDEEKRLLDNIRDLAVIENGENLGLAKALNQGLQFALESGAKYILLLDQDSRPSSNMLMDLCADAQMLDSQHRRTAALAVRLVDRKARSATVGSRESALGARATFATSGSLLFASALSEIGLMREDLFIDGIDHEWCFRARAAGFDMLMAPRISMEHDMGDDGVSIAGRYRPIHRSAFRHYFIVRNSLWLARVRHIPLRWRAKELVKTMYRIPIYISVSTSRVASLKAITRGLRDGWSGPLSDREQQLVRRSAPIHRG